LFEGDVPEELLNKAREVLKDINITDNIVQKSCEDEAKKSNCHIRNYQLELAYIEIDYDKNNHMYFGVEVNTQWDTEFVKDENGNWKAVAL
jgi:hypothetical protein